MQGSVAPGREIDLDPMTVITSGLHTGQEDPWRQRGVPINYTRTTWEVDS